jgi:hypothetical protein
MQIMQADKANLAGLFYACCLLAPAAEALAKACLYASFPTTISAQKIDLA